MTEKVAISGVSVIQTNGTTGLIMGVANNSTQTNCIHLLHTSNVGIGTNSPDTKLHLCMIVFRE
jgi:hypothetical protein